MQVEFKHEVGKKIVININGLTGKVCGNFVGSFGEKLTLVDYADANCVVHRAYFSEDEVD